MSKPIKDTIFDKADDLLGDKIAELLTQQLLAALILKLPFLANPFLKGLASRFLNNILRTLVKETFTGAEIIKIRLDGREDIKALQKAHQAYMIMKESGDRSGLKKAEHALAVQYRNLIRLNK